MAKYVINQRSVLFPGRPGDVFTAKPGPMLDAAAAANLVTRLEDPTDATPKETSEEKPSKTQENKPSTAPSLSKN
jgi:hypothetical protein